MLLKKISVSHLGGIQSSSWSFTDTLNVIKERYSDELFGAIATVLHNKSTPCIPSTWLCKESSIDTVVSIDEKAFLVKVTPTEDLKGIKLSALDEENRDVTAEYRYLSSHCKEHDLSDIFNGNEKYAFLKIVNDMNEAEVSKSSPNEFLRIKAFRSYMFDYIKNFKPELLREGKRYEIVLEKSGIYCVRHTDGEKRPVFLSESEQTLFRYLCFLRTAEFWQGFEELRNLHSVKKPILTRDFLERLDESIDTQNVLERTKRLNRQIIMLTI